MQVQLLKPWNGFRVGMLFPIMADGVANVLIRRGIAKHVDGNDKSTDSDKRAGAGTSDAVASEKATRNRKHGHSPR